MSYNVRDKCMNSNLEKIIVTTIQKSLLISREKGKKSVYKNVNG